MTELLTAAQMRAIEQAAIASGEVTGLELMERAGQGVVAAVLEEWPELALTSHRAVVLCGPGNNGGDGFVVARLLKERGWQVEVFLYGDAERLPVDARVNYERWGGIGTSEPLERFDIATYSLRAAVPAGHPWVFDALFGTGLSRPLEGEIAKMVKKIGKLQLGARPAIIAIDLPSGICSDSGRTLGAAMPADLIVTFHAPKLGHYLADGQGRSGVLKVKSIGIPVGWPHPLKSVVLTLGEPNLYVAALDKAWRPEGGPAHHKYDHGHVLVPSGPATRTGAARLAARGALRIGAGLVTIGAPETALAEHAARLDAIMLRRVDGTDDLADLLADPRINALCLGPGLGLDARAAGLLATALGQFPPVPGLTRNPEGQSETPADRGPGSGAGAGADRGPTDAATARRLVLDADALTLLSRDPALFALLHETCILTPHAGEFARLFPDIAEKLAAPATTGPAYSKVDATREAAARAGCVVLFKGPDTVIADPEGRCSINSAAYDRAAPWLATAGSGDVLAGMICGLLARGFAPMQAAETAAWLHVEAARSFGPGLIAEDLPEELPKVFRSLGL